MVKYNPSTKTLEIKISLLASSALPSSALPSTALASSVSFFCVSSLSVSFLFLHFGFCPNFSERFVFLISPSFIVFPYVIKGSIKKKRIYRNAVCQISQKMLINPSLTQVTLQE